MEQMVEPNNFTTASTVDATVHRKTLLFSALLVWKSFLITMEEGWDASAENSTFVNSLDKLTEKKRATRLEGLKEICAAFQSLDVREEVLEQ